jgi:hypothetical protein
VEQVADVEEVSPRTIYNLIDDLKLAGVQDKAQKDIQDKEERKKNQGKKKEKVD